MRLLHCLSFAAVTLLGGLLLSACVPATPEPEEETTASEAPAAPAPPAEESAAPAPPAPEPTGEAPAGDDATAPAGEADAPAEAPGSGEAVETEGGESSALVVPGRAMSAGMAGPEIGVTRRSEELFEVSGNLGEGASVEGVIQHTGDNEWLFTGEFTFPTGGYSVEGFSATDIMGSPVPAEAGPLPVVLNMPVIKPEPGAVTTQAVEVVPFEHTFTAPLGSVFSLVVSDMRPFLQGPEATPESPGAGS